jgi:23S rRNA (cytidine1920-2'-O)/16S rRNA (cytidine1409-2'-O)-methyltransferase
MRIDIALKEKMNISRQKAKELIAAGNVSVNGKVITKPSLDVEESDSIKVDAETDILRYVGRGGLKLERALKVFDIKPEGLVCMDIGASTGGFTDCLLQNGARLVYAVDVGSCQLADRLREDERVISVENADIRSAELPVVDFICMDVSFISVKKVLYRVDELLSDSGEAVVLIKPQFEAGRENLNKNGIVANPKVHKKVLRDITDFAKEIGFNLKGLTYSPVKGGDGNIEYLMYLTRKDCIFTKDTDAVVREAAEELGR